MISVYYSERTFMGRTSKYEAYFRYASYKFLCRLTDEASIKYCLSSLYEEGRAADQMFRATYEQEALPASNTAFGLIARNDPWINDSIPLRFNSVNDSSILSFSSTDGRQLNIRLLLSSKSYQKGMPVTIPFQYADNRTPSDFLAMLTGMPREMTEEYLDSEPANPSSSSFAEEQCQSIFHALGLIFRDDPESCGYLIQRCFAPEDLYNLTFVFKDKKIFMEKIDTLESRAYPTQLLSMRPHIMGGKASKTAADIIFDRNWSIQMNIRMQRLDDIPIKTKTIKGTAIMKISGPCPYITTSYASWQ